jgi:hypothetical protein
VQIDKNTGVSIGLAVSLMAGAVWVGTMNARLAEQERQTTAQWRKMSKMEAIVVTQAEIKGELKAIRQLLESQ